MIIQNGSWCDYSPSTVQQKCQVNVYKEREMCVLPFPFKKPFLYASTNCIWRVGFKICIAPYWSELIEALERGFEYNYEQKFDCSKTLASSRCGVTQASLSDWVMILQSTLIERLCTDDICCLGVFPDLWENRNILSGDSKHRETLFKEHAIYTVIRN